MVKRIAAEQGQGILGSGVNFDRFELHLLYQYAADLAQALHSFELD